MQKYNLAIAGATGNVGREMLQILEQRNFPINKIFCLASARSKGKKLEFNNKEITVEDLAEFDFSKVDIGLFSPGAKVSAEFVPKATSSGCLIIDNCGLGTDIFLCFRSPSIGGNRLGSHYHTEYRLGARHVGTFRILITRIGRYGDARRPP